MDHQALTKNNKISEQNVTRNFHISRILEIANRTLKPSDDAKYQKKDSKISLQLDYGTTDELISSHLQMCIGENALMSATPKSNDSGIRFIANNGHDLRDKNMRNVVQLPKSGDNEVSALLVQPDEGEELKISAIVVSDKLAGTSTRIPIENVVFSDKSMREFVVAPTLYSMLEHLRDICGGYLRPNFYEKVNTHGYGLTMRSLVRHAVNNMEMYMAKNRVQFGSAKNSAKEKSDSERLTPSFAKNMFVANAKCPDKVVGSYGGLKVGRGSKLIAQCENLSKVNSSTDRLVCQQVRRQLGIDETLSTAESSTLIGVSAVGIALSMIFKKRRPLMQKMGARTAPISLKRIGFS